MVRFCQTWLLDGLAGAEAFQLGPGLSRAVVSNGAGTIDFSGARFAGARANFSDTFFWSFDYSSRY